ncbi:MAG: FMN-binding protein [Nitrospina sp.]|nr:FMN-binding protein [Nitrospina sp.]
MALKPTRILLGVFVFAASLGIFIPTSFSEEEEKVLDVQVYLTKKQAFEIAFPGADKVDREKKWLTDEQKKAIGDLCLQNFEPNRMTFYVGKRDGVPMGYAIIDHEIGKSFPITFMVVLNVDGSVRDVEIMVYREPRGWEVRYPSFMDQFTGKNADTDYRIINSITGATLSVRAMVKGVSRATAAYKVLYLSAKP